MRLTHQIVYAAKFVWGQSRRYIFLLSAVAFSFAVITAIITLAEGMTESVNRAARNHYAGQVFVVGFDKAARSQGRIEKPAEILKTIKAAGITPERVVIRTSSFGEGILYFGGNEARQKYVFGIDWESEKKDFDSLSFAEGAPPERLNKTDILISQVSAEELGAHVGDDVLLDVVTRTGQKNTGTFVVRGIIADSSVFGAYKSFVDRTRLNALLRYGADEASTIGLFFKPGENLTVMTDRVYRALEKKIPLGPPIAQKSELTYQMSLEWRHIKYLVFPLSVYVSEVSQLLDALRYTAYGLYGVIIVIVLASITSTYRTILRDRLREIGTLRVLGLQSRGAHAVLLWESGLVFAAGLLVGTGFSFVLTGLFSLIPFDWIPGFEIFMRNGRLAASYSWGLLLTNAAIFAITSLPSVWLPALRACHGDLVHSLSGGA